jgi:hypothetical protein
VAGIAHVVGDADHRLRQEKAEVEGNFNDQRRPGDQVILGQQG